MTQFSASKPPRIAIIGAGLAGVACARALKDAGLHPVIFEKSRGLGGRLATRRAEDGWRFDHGAQYVTARMQAFRKLMDSSLAEEAAAVWRPVAVLADGEEKERRPDEDWFIGAPSMNGFVKLYAGDLDVRLGAQVGAVRRAGDELLLDICSSQAPDAAAFDIVVSAAPAPQAQALAQDAAPGLAERLSSVRMSPCWAAMIGFRSRYDPGFDVWRGSRPAGRSERGLSWISRNASKPGRDPYKDGWVVHASPEWSARHLEEDNETVLEAMLDMLRAELPGPMPEIAYARAHRWRYALTTEPLGAAYAADATNSFFAIGDWCLGPRVECAFESGAALGADLALRFGQ